MICRTGWWLQKKYPFSPPLSLQTEYPEFWLGIQQPHINSILPCCSYGWFLTNKIEAKSARATSRRLQGRVLPRGFLNVAAAWVVCSIQSFPIETQTGIFLSPQHQWNNYKQAPASPAIFNADSRYQTQVPMFIRRELTNSTISLTQPQSHLWQQKKSIF